jgi:hypothetical protein
MGRLIRAVWILRAGANGKGGGNKAAKGDDDWDDWDAGKGKSSKKGNADGWDDWGAR